MADKDTPLVDAQALPAGVQEIIDNIKTSGGTSNNPRSGTDVSTKRTRLTTDSALAILRLAAEDAGYTLKITKQDVAQFIKEFDEAQSKQLEKVVTSTAQKTTPGATAGAVDKTMESSTQTEFASFFRPGDFAVDWIWKKINFKDEQSLGGKALKALGEVRGAVQAFQVLGVTENDIRVAAKEIARGSKTLAQYKAELQQVAKREYPQFADRFAADPELTTYDIASPVIKLLAKTWEVDEKEVSIDDPIVSSYINYAGPDGKGQAPSRYDLVQKAKKHRKYQETTEANDNARDAAVGLARAFGFGV